jgi:hypothetical protein
VICPHYHTANPLHTCPLLCSLALCMLLPAAEPCTAIGCMVHAEILACTLHCTLRTTTPDPRLTTLAADWLMPMRSVQSNSTCHLLVNIQW